MEEEVARVSLDALRCRNLAPLPFRDTQLPLPWAFGAAKRSGEVKTRLALGCSAGVEVLGNCAWSVMKSDLGDVVLLLLERAQEVSSILQ